MPGIFKFLRTCPIPDPSGIIKRIKSDDAFGGLHTDGNLHGDELSNDEAMPLNFWVPLENGGSFEHRSLFDRKMANGMRKHPNKFNYSDDNIIETETKKSEKAFIENCQKKCSFILAQKIFNDGDRLQPNEKTLLVLNKEGKAFRTTGKACVFFGGRTPHSAVQIVKYEGEIYGVVINSAQNKLVAFPLNDVPEAEHCNTLEEATEKIVKEGLPAATFNLPDAIKSHSKKIVEDEKEHIGKTPKKENSQTLAELNKMIIDMHNEPLVGPVCQYLIERINNNELTSDDIADFHLFPDLAKTIITECIIQKPQFKTQYKTNGEGNNRFNDAISSLSEPLTNETTKQTLTQALNTESDTDFVNKFKQTYHPGLFGGYFGRNEPTKKGILDRSKKKPTSATAVAVRAMRMET